MTDDNPTDEDGQLLTAAEVAKLRMIHRSQVFRLRSCGTLPRSVRVGPPGGLAAACSAPLPSLLYHGPRYPLSRRAWRWITVAASGGGPAVSTQRSAPSGQNPATTSIAFFDNAKLWRLEDANWNSGFRG